MCLVIFLFAILCLQNVQGATLDDNVNKTKVAQFINGMEVPDDFLLMLDQLRSNSTLMATTLSRQNQEGQNGTSSNNRRCVCDKGVCKCCTGYFLDLLKQKACMRITYHPGDFAFDVAMSLNNRVLYENSLSGKNPRPICISPPRMNNLKVCAKFYNVFFPGRNFHFCLAMTGQWRSFELFNFAFDCLRMGANGIAMVKPFDDVGIPIATPQGQGGVDAVVDAGEDDIEDYDENVVRSILSLFDR
ncbi:hypothetical protein PYW07_007045 [Mythimna separata]|uniref:DUF4773 domain-containing protein n=1 Tax=Mythimna separata TaxID=271217 RepID=A0AAD7Z1I1_MYTSE|nr:hypothetical protein PYW07_007045 [Mythimna separata]